MLHVLRMNQNFSGNNDFSKGRAQKERGGSVVFYHLALGPLPGLGVGVGDSFRFGDRYRISELCELVFIEPFPNWKITKSFQFQFIDSTLRIHLSYHLTLRKLLFRRCE